MIVWIENNIANIVVCVILIVLVVLVIRKMINDRRKGTGCYSCSGDCAECMRRSSCESKNGRNC